MTSLLIAAGLVCVAVVAFGLWQWRASRDPLDRRATRSRAVEVLRQSLATVPANAFDARLRIVRQA
jgi:hypothetical protein